MIISNFHVKNQFLLEGKNFRLLQSYNSLVALKYNGTLYLGKDHDYSTTTSKYVTMFTGLTTKERRQGLKNGTIKELNEQVLSKVRMSL